LKLLADYTKPFNKNENCLICEYIQNGVVTEEYASEEYDFVLYSDVTSTITNKIIRTTRQVGEPMTYEVSNEKFIMVEITVENQTISVQFNNDQTNYYIVGNCFDNKFILFFIMKHYPDFCKNKSQLKKGYKLKIIDSNIDIKETDETNSIFITKNGYDILPNK